MNRGQTCESFSEFVDLVGRHVKDRADQSKEALPSQDETTSAEPEVATVDTPAGSMNPMNTPETPMQTVGGVDKLDHGGTAGIKPEVATVDTTAGSMNPMNTTETPMQTVGGVDKPDHDETTPMNTTKPLETPKPKSKKQGSRDRPKPKATEAGFDTVAFGRGLQELHHGRNDPNSSLRRAVSATGAAFEMGRVSPSTRAMLGKHAFKAVQAVLQKPTASVATTNLDTAFTHTNSPLRALYATDAKAVDALILSCHKQ
jgi:hypothetical protein